MPSTATTRNRLEKQAAGENSNTWGTLLNTLIDLVDFSLDGMTSITMAAGTTVLTATNYVADESRARYLNLTGTNGTIQIPNLQKLYLVRNAGTGDAIITTGSGTTTTVAAGSTTWVVCEAGNIVRQLILPISGGGTGGTTAATARTALGLAIGTNVQAYDALLLSIAGLTFGADNYIYGTGADAAAAGTITAFGRSLVDDADAATGRTTLGLGTISTQAAASVAITGGSVTGITDITVADGGTGASTAANARTNLGLVIGTDVQAYDADLGAIAALTSAADKVAYSTGAQTWALADFTATGRSVVAGASAAAVRTTLGVVIGTDVQAYDADLGAIAALVSAADKIPYATGIGTWALADFSAAGRALVDDASAAAQRTTLGLAIGTDVQAYDAELAAIAGLVSAADRLAYFTGSGTASLATFTAAGRALVDDADASAQRTTLGLGTMATATASDYAALASPAFTGTPTSLGFEVGFRNIPQVAKSAAFTFANTDRGKHIYYTGGAAAATIDPNATTAIDADAAITVVNNGSGVLTLTRGAGVALKWAGAGADANRALAVGGMCTLLKVATNTWFVSGAGLS